jgi:hypothetical protein
MGIPSGLAANVVSTHSLVTSHQVLEGHGNHGMEGREGVGGGRAIEDNVGGFPLIYSLTFLIDGVLLPKGEDFFFLLRKVWLGFNRRKHGSSSIIY